MSPSIKKSWFNQLKWIAAVVVVIFGIWVYKFIDSALESAYAEQFTHEFGYTLDEIHEAVEKMRRAISVND